jgi:ABC-type oligopeptide transport system substrate-binding subunit/class 3 adenylate cyclase
MSIREERRVVTALFADLVGSTPLGERLDTEEYKLVIAEAVSRMVAAVEGFDGTVKDLAGDGVLALFGAPIAHEDDPERAILAGFKILEDISTFAREVAEAWQVDGLAVRVGIETGPVVTGAIGGGSRVEYGAVGDAVNTAARLQSAADPGSVLVGPVARDLTQAAFDWGPVHPATLKGKEEALDVAEALGVTGVSARAHATGDGAMFVGRVRELGSLREAAAAVADGSGRIVIVTGEPGIGKTRLVGELRRLFAASTPAHGRALWLEGRCVSYGQSLPYYPFRDLLRSWLGITGDEPQLRVRIALRKQLERLYGDRAAEPLPYLAALLEIELDADAAARLAELSPEAMRFRTFEVVRTLVERLAADGPVAVAIEDLQWADATSLDLLAQIAADTETEALLLVCTSRLERDHASWGVKEDIERRFPHRSTDLELGALGEDAERDLLAAMVGGSLPPELVDRILSSAEGNPFFLEELVRSFADAGALVHGPEGWWFDASAAPEIPLTIEKVILSRLDKLTPTVRNTATAGAVLGRTFSLPLLEAVCEESDVRGPLSELMRLDLLREGRRWPEPEFSFKHALIQETAYRTLVRDDRRTLHRRAAEWLESKAAGREHEGAGLLAHHWLGADDEDKAIRYLTMAGDGARLAYALDEAVAHYRELLPLLERRGQRQEMALVLFKLALALHMSLRFAEANDAYQRAFPLWEAPAGPADPPAASLRVSTSFLPNDNDPRSAIAWPNIQLCMQLFDRLVEQWPERTIVPSLAERWEIDDDGLRYVFHLREGLTWSDGTPLVAGDVEFGIRRVLDPEHPGSSVAIYFVLEGGLEHYLGERTDPDLIGVHALDDRTIEFRLAAPAPYFMSVMNRPDGAPQPRHAIETAGDDWIGDGQVVSGAFAIEARTAAGLTLVRRSGERRTGNVARVEYVHEPIATSVEPYREDQLDLVAVRYTPRGADVVDKQLPDQRLGPPTWSGYLAFRHADPVLGNVRVRKALAHAVDRSAVAATLPPNLMLATGGIVPPALQGHTPDIALRFDPDAARALLPEGVEGIAVACLEDDAGPIEAVLASWREALGLACELRTWSAVEVATMPPPVEHAPVYFTGWLPGYADPEYILRLLFHSKSHTNEGGFASAAFDDLIERARQERGDRGRLELFHDADRMAVTDAVAAIPLVYGRSSAAVKPWVHGWWEFGKSSSNFADLVVDEASPRVREAAP